eukprot:367528-Hanusia_phi.AAC.1
MQVKNFNTKQSQDFRSRCWSVKADMPREDLGSRRHHEMRVQALVTQGSGGPAMLDRICLPGSSPC